MKTISRRVCLFALLALIILGHAVRAAPEPSDPLVGDWLWHEGRPVSFRADGTVYSSQDFQGTWVYLHNPEVQRHYRVVWNQGRYVDLMALSEDGKHARVRNEAGGAKSDQYEVRRVISDKPAATVNAATANDPVVGNWLWRGDFGVTFKADGTFTSTVGMQGTWTFLNNPETERKYRLIWNHGLFIDEMICSRDGQQASVRNQKGERFDVRRAIADKPVTTPTPGKPPNYFGGSGG